jgi:hypothetical protein
MLVPFGNSTYLYSCLINRGIIIVAIDNSNARGNSLLIYISIGPPGAGNDSKRK